MLGFLAGNKTYITVGLAAVAYAAFVAGLITQEQLETILMGIGIPAVGFLRAAIARQPAETAKKVEEKVVERAAEKIAEDRVRQPLMPPPSSMHR